MGAATSLEFLNGGGTTGGLMRELDWAKTSVGPISSWPQSLRTTLSILLHSRQPMFLWWGPELVQFYNDAYLPSFGTGKHPTAMGQRGADCWQEIWPIIWPQIDDVMSRGKASWNEDQLVPIFRNGSIEDVYWTYGYSPVFREDGAIGGTLVVCTETTARVVAERRSQSASRAKDEFFAMLGHELRNPLSPIVGALKLMKQRGDGRWGKPEEVIQRQVTHLVRLVDDLLDVSKVTRGKIELKKETVELSGVITRAVEMASVLLDERRHSLVMSVPPRGQRWHGDPVRLAQVIANLLTNAARYTNRGGKIELRAAIEGGELVVSVKDNGIGIAAEMLPRVFDMFVQEKRTTDRAEGGLGLGLTLVKNLVQLHGGTVVGASPGIGEGSEFTIRLPGATQAAAESIVSASVMRPVAGASKRVLLVDDNADAADMLGELLELEGHQVTIARDPVAALEQVAASNPEVAVLDIGLPVMDGYELASRMRAIVPSCRLIALSGYGQPNDLVRSKEAGFYRHLVKPFDLAALLQLVSA